MIDPISPFWDGVFQIVIGLVALKAVVVGSEFSFYHWWKYGAKYTKWYTSRETFDDYINDDPLGPNVRVFKQAKCPICKCNREFIKTVAGSWRCTSCNKVHTAI